MPMLWNDLKAALRSLGRSRGFAATAIATLAVAVALQTSVVAVINAYVLRALPYPEAERLYNVRYVAPPAFPPRELENVDWRSVADVAEHTIAWDLDVFYMLGGEYPERAPGAWVTPGFIDGYGIRAAFGRTLVASDFEPGQPQVALISHALWQTRFGGDSAVLGRSFNGYVSDRPADPESFTIVGVLPERFWHVNPFTQVITPLRGTSYPYVVRLRENVAPEDAARRIENAVRDARIALPPNWALELRPLQADYVTAARPMLVAAGSAVTVVVLIACANVALLMILRGMRRRKEIAVRLALGAGMWRIARQLLAESMVLMGAALTIGVGSAMLVLRAFAPAIEQQLGRRAPGGPEAMTIDWRVAAIALASAVVVAAALSLAPLMDARRAAASLRERRSRGSSGSRTGSALIGLEVAGSVALLAGCGLLVRSVIGLLGVDLGMQTNGVIATTMAIREQSYPEAAQRAALHERLLASVAGVSGVRSAALAAPSPLETYQPQPLRSSDAPSSATTPASTRTVAGAYFETIGIPIVRGRDFGGGDRFGGANVAIVSETAARRLWPNVDPLGARITQIEQVRPGGDTVFVERTVVGIARDVRQSPTDEELVDVYVPLAQSPGRFVSAVLRTSGPSPSWLGTIRTAVRGVDAEIALGTLIQLDDVTRQQLARPRFLVALFGAFGVFATLLGVMGLYAVIAYAVRQREHEIAVRMAVGADAGRIVRLFLREGAFVVMAGIVAGVGAAVVLGRVLRSQLYGVQPADVATLGAVALLLAVASAVAIWWPARRATRVDPIVPLRDD